MDKNRLARKHATGHSSQRSNLVQTENGIIGAESKKEFTKVNRIDWGHGDHSDEPLIGGTAMPDQYKSVYTSQTLGEGTQREQLSLIKRTMKPIPDKPVEDKKPQRQAVHFKENFPEITPEQRNPSGTRSLIADLGESLVHIAPDPPAVRRKTKN